MKNLIRILGVGLLLLTPFFVFAQGIPSPVHFSITAPQGTISTGKPVTVVVHADIDKGWHLYANKLGKNGPVPTTFKITSDNARITGKIEEGKLESTYDPNFQMKLSWHSDSANFRIPVTFDKATPSVQELKVQVHYMTCNDHECLPPTKKVLTTRVNVEKGNKSAVLMPSKTNQGGGPAITQGYKPTESSTNARIQGDLNAYTGKGIFSFLWIAITAGFAALLTPCVFPMIPLTVSYFSKQSGGDRKQAVSSALLFGLAIILTFTLIGSILAVILGASGASRFASNPWVNLSLGIIFVLFAISLLGLFELRLPYQLTNYLNRQSTEKKGLAGILFMGLTISAVSFSCTAPFVGAILAATTLGRWFYPVIGMIAFSAAFSIPFILFAMFPRWLESLPRSGEWMNSVKVILGFIELAAAFKFLSNADLVWNWNIVTRPLTISAWIVISALAGFYLLGKLRLAHESKREHISTVRLLLAIPFLAFSLYLVPGLMGASLGIWDAWLPPKKATDVSVVSTIVQNSHGSTADNPDGNWASDLDSARKTAVEQNEPLFIDFTGYTCTNCRAMESNVFALDKVKQRFRKFRLVRLYTDDGTNGPKNQLYQFKLTGTVALPTYAIINPQNGRLISMISGYTEPGAFIKFLDRGLKQFSKNNQEG